MLLYVSMGKIDRRAMMEEFGRRLTLLMARADVSGNELARRTGLRQSAISDMTTGKRKRIFLDEIVAIARELGVPTTELIGESSPSESVTAPGDAGHDELIILEMARTVGYPEARRRLMQPNPSPASAPAPASATPDPTEPWKTLSVRVERPGRRDDDDDDDDPPPSDDPGGLQDRGRKRNHGPSRHH